MVNERHGYIDLITQTGAIYGKKFYFKDVAKGFIEVIVYSRYMTNYDTKVLYRLFKEIGYEYEDAEIGEVDKFLLKTDNSVNAINFLSRMLDGFCK